MLRTTPPSTRQRCQYVCGSCRSKGFGSWTERMRSSPHSSASVKFEGLHRSTSKAFSSQPAISRLRRDSRVLRRSYFPIPALPSHSSPHSKNFSTTPSLSSASAERSKNTEKESTPDKERTKHDWEQSLGIPRESGTLHTGPVRAKKQTEASEAHPKKSPTQETQQDDKLDQGLDALPLIEDGVVSRPAQFNDDSEAFTKSDTGPDGADDAIDPPGVTLAEALKNSRKDDRDRTPSTSNVEKRVREDKDESTAHFERLALDDVPIVALKVPQPQVPRLHHGLDRVLFNPGVYYVQDPRSRVFNFDPHVSKITPATEFDFDALGSFTPPSEDPVLKKIARKHKVQYYSSTSSTTGVLSHLHYLISHWRKLDLSTFSKGFTQPGDNFTTIQKAPVSVFVKKDGSNYAITNDKSGIDDNGSSLLSLAGRSLEKLFTTSTKDFEKLRLVDDGKGSKKSKTASKKNAIPAESFHYTKFNDFIVRSQLDAHDARLPGTGMFDLKTRAVAPIRMDLHGRIPDKTNYQITDNLGNSESFERERFDMMRATMLKYSLQARLGRMDGIFVAYHNLDTIFGFQYISLPELDKMLHGTSMTLLGDYELRYSMKMFSAILDKARQSLPDQHFRLVIETREKQLPFTYIFAEPVSEEEYRSANEAAKKRQQEDEKLLRSGRIQIDSQPEGDAIEPSLLEPGEKEAELQQWLDFKDAVKEEISQDAVSALNEDSDRSSDAQDRDKSSLLDDTDSPEVLEHECWLLERTTLMLKQDINNLADPSRSLEQRVLRQRWAHVQHDLELSRQTLEQLKSRAKALQVRESAKAVKGALDSLSATAKVLNNYDARLKEIQVKLSLRSDGEPPEDIDPAEHEKNQQSIERLILTRQRFAVTVNMWANLTHPVLKRPLSTLEISTYRSDQRALRHHIEETEQLVEKMQAINSATGKYMYRTKFLQSGLSTLLKLETKLEQAWAKVMSSAQATTEELPLQKSDGIAESKPTTQSSAPSIATDKSDRPLLAYVLTCRNIVNGQYVERPNHLRHDHTWTLEYSIEEITDKKLARERYQACQNRRRTAMSRVRDESKIDKWYRSGFMKALIGLSEKGKHLKEEQMKIDAEKPIVVFEERKDPKPKRVEEKKDPKPKPKPKPKRARSGPTEKSVALHS